MILQRVSACHFRHFTRFFYSSNHIYEVSLFKRKIVYLCILKLRTYGFVRMGFRDGKNSCNVPDLISKDNFKCQELSELTIPKGFLVSKCDVGNWIFSKSKEFFSEIAWKILGGFFGRKFLEGSFGRNF